MDSSREDISLNSFGAINFENIIGTNAGEKISGDSQNNEIYGSGGSDIIYGGDGNDFLSPHNEVINQMENTVIMCPWAIALLMMNYMVKRKRYPSRNTRR